MPQSSTFNRTSSTLFNSVGAIVAEVATVTGLTNYWAFVTSVFEILFRF